MLYIAAISLAERFTLDLMRIDASTGERELMTKTCRRECGNFKRNLGRYPWGPDTQN